MKRCSLLSFALILILTLTGWVLAQQTASQPRHFDGNSWWAHVKFLADDSLEGRETGSDGLRKAQSYVVDQFTKAKLQPLIGKRGRQLVRVTGLLTFDSEHFLGHHLVRHNDWEIHPVLKLEYCIAATCQDTNDVGWRSLDDR